MQTKPTKFERAREKKNQTSYKHWMLHSCAMSLELFSSIVGHLRQQSKGEKKKTKNNKNKRNSESKTKKNSLELISFGDQEQRPI